MEAKDWQSLQMVNVLTSFHLNTSTFPHLTSPFCTICYFLPILKLAVSKRWVVVLVSICWNCLLTTTQNYSLSYSSKPVSSTRVCPYGRSRASTKEVNFKWVASHWSLYCEPFLGPSEKVHLTDVHIHTLYLVWSSGNKYGPTFFAPPIPLCLYCLSVPVVHYLSIFPVRMSTYALPDAFPLLRSLPENVL